MFGHTGEPAPWTEDLYYYQTFGILCLVHHFPNTHMSRSSFYTAASVIFLAFVLGFALAGVLSVAPATL